MTKARKLAVIVLLSLFSVAAFAAKVNINEATKDELMKNLEGISSKQADYIIEYRQKDGGFESAHELMTMDKHALTRDQMSKNQGNIVWD